MLNTNKIKLILILFFAAAISGFLYWTKTLKRTPIDPVPQTNQSQFVVPQFPETKNFANNQSPEYFPVELVPPATVKILKNEERQGSSQLSYVLVYESQRTLAENKDYFQNFWDKDQWQAGQGLEEDGRSILAASKGSNSLTVSLYQAKAGDPVIVNLIYLQAK